MRTHFRSHSTSKSPCDLLLRSWLCLDFLSIAVLIALVLSLSAALTAKAGFAGQLTINSMHTEPTAKKALDLAIQAFEKKHPDIKVRINRVDHESYKVQLRTWLPNNPPDVVTWFAGNRAKFFIERGLVEPIDDIWGDIKADYSPAVQREVSHKGRYYLMPANYYHWGVYYRKDLFAKAGIKQAPRTWQELIAAVKALKASGVRPFTIGTKFGWPAAAWFDFLNLRMHGAEFYRQLLAGAVPYTDPRVQKVMTVWQELVQLEAFPRNAPAMSWQDASALLWQGKAAMYLMGNFISTEIPADVRAQVEFFPFPMMDAKVPKAELAPTDVYFIPAKAKNKQAAKTFLRFLATVEAQELMNAVNRLIPANSKAKVSNPDRFQTAGVSLLREADDLIQFFDRDAHPEVAKVGMNAFVEFMRYPERSQKILAKIDRTRKRVKR